VRIVLGLVIGIGENLIGGLDDDEALFGLFFLARVSVGVIFEDYKITMVSSGDDTSFRLNIPSDLYCFLIWLMSAPAGRPRSA
jgi:hypothetical protein